MSFFTNSRIKPLEAQITELKAEVRKKDDQIWALVDRLLVMNQLPPTKPLPEPKSGEGVDLFGEVDDRGEPLVERDEDTEHILYGEER